MPKGWCDLQRGFILQHRKCESLSKVTHREHNNGSKHSHIFISLTIQAWQTNRLISDAGKSEVPLTTRSITISSNDFWSSAAVTSQRYLAVSDLVALVISNVAGSLITALFSRSPVGRQTCPTISVINISTQPPRRLTLDLFVCFIHYLRSSCQSKHNLVPHLLSSSIQFWDWL